MRRFLLVVACVAMLLAVLGAWAISECWRVEYGTGDAAQGRPAWGVELSRGALSVSVGHSNAGGARVAVVGLYREPQWLAMKFDDRRDWIPAVAERSTHSGGGHVIILPLWVAVAAFGLSLWLSLRSIRRLPMPAEPAPLPLANG